MKKVVVKCIYYFSFLLAFIIMLLIFDVLTIKNGKVTVKQENPDIYQEERVDT